MILDEDGQVGLERPRARGELDTEGLAGPEARLGEQAAGVGPIARRIAIARQRGDLLCAEPPEAHFAELAMAPP